MAKYRLLTEEELTQFEDEFVKFLVVNGITADDWVKMKEEKKAAAEKILALFSDVIFEQILRKAMFLETRQQGYLQAIQCLPDKMIMIALSTSDKSIDFTKEFPTSVDQFELHKGEKSYDSNRESEMFDLVQKGYEISDGSLFKSLILSSV